jgi:hypothetical protein
MITAVAGVADLITDSGLLSFSCFLHGNSEIAMPLF